MIQNSDMLTRQVFFICPDCGKEMQREVTLPRGMFFFRNGDRLICEPCANIRKAAEMRRAEIERLQAAINASAIPPMFRVWDGNIGNNALLEWAKYNSGKNILLISEVNTGKTRALCCALLDEVKAGANARFIEFAELAAQYSGAKKEGTTAAQKLVKRVLSCDVVFLDDIDKQRITETTGELLYKLLNSVYSGTANARLWLTMNHSGRELLQRFENADHGAAVVSRIERMMNDDRFAVKHF